MENTICFFFIKTLNLDNKNNFQRTLKTCLVIIFGNYFLFSKKKRNNKTLKTHLTISYSFCYEKHK